MKSRTTLKRVALTTAIATSLLGISHSASAAEWTSTVVSGTPTSAGWSSTTDPGWTTGGVPNAPGATAEVVSTISGITGAYFETVQNTGAPVTLGTIRYGNGNAVGNYYWQITPTDGITLDSGVVGTPALITANSTTATSNNELYLNGGNLTLASNLEVINNTTASTTSAGSIALWSSIGETGGAKSVTYTNNAPIPNLLVSATAGRNSIGVNGAFASTYTGGTTIAKGVVEFKVNQTINSNTMFGTGTITLGSGNNSAALVKYDVTSAAGASLTNNITLAPNSTGTLSIGVIGTGANSMLYTGTIDLNGSNLTIISNSNTFDAVRFTGNITGNGNVIIPGGGVTTFRDTLKTYNGDTIFNGGSLIIRSGNQIPDGPGKGNVVFNAAAFLHMGGGETINGLSGNFGTIQPTTQNATFVLTLGGNDATASYGGVIGRNGTGGVSVTKIGTGTQTLSGANITLGNYLVNAGTLKLTRSAALHNSLSANWLDTKIGVAADATLALNVGGTGFTSAQLDILKVLGTATGGFMNNSILGLDTSVATAGNFTYANGLADTNGGANVRNIRKMGANTLSLSGASTYTGSTKVEAGILNFATQAAYYNNNTGGEWSNSTGAKLVVSPGATAGFTIGGGGEFTEADIATINANGSATGGFLAGSNIGLSPSVATYTYGTAITNASGNSIGLVKFGPNELVLNQANSYTGNTTVSAGTLTVGANVGISTNGPLGNSANAILLGDANTSTNNVSLLTNGAFTIARDVNVTNNGTGLTTIGGSTNHNSTFSGTITLGKRLNLTSVATGGNELLVSGKITGADHLHKVGSGVATLSSAANDMSSLVWVDAGTLRVTGSHNMGTGNGAYIVGFGATDSGTLEITGTLNSAPANAGEYSMEIGTFGTGVVNQLAGSSVTFGGAAGIIAIGDGAGGTGTYNLSGGTLDVAAGGVGKIMAGPGTANFNFTGGTLKVKLFNPTDLAGSFVGGGLTQNGVGSLLDVTGNDTVLQGGYALGAGNATVGAGRTLTINGGMTNSAGTGVVSVNSGGAMVSNNIRTDTLALNGTATINADGGTAGASKVETLTISAGGKLNLKDNDLVVGTAPNFNAVRTAIIAGKTNNAAAGITSDMTGFGISRGFGYAMGNDPKVSSLLAGSLAGQAFDTDSVLVKYTLLGDADLDGDTDLNDLGLWSNGYTGDLGANPPAPTTFWTGGDFDYDGDTDLNDLGLWSSTYTGDFNGGPGSLVVNAPNASPEAVAILNSMGFTVVPEPSTFVLAGVGLAGLAVAARRRKK